MVLWQQVIPADQSDRLVSALCGLGPDFERVCTNDGEMKPLDYDSLLQALGAYAQRSPGSRTFDDLGGGMDFKGEVVIFLVRNRPIVGSTIVMVQRLIAGQEADPSFRPSSEEGWCEVNSYVLVGK